MSCSRDFGSGASGSPPGANPARPLHSVFTVTRQMFWGAPRCRHGYAPGTCRLNEILLVHRRATAGHVAMTVDGPVPALVAIDEAAAICTCQRSGRRTDRSPMRLCATGSPTVRISPSCCQRMPTPTASVGTDVGDTSHPAR